jgi:hypothetical protein
VTSWPERSVAYALLLMVGIVIQGCGIFQHKVRYGTEDVPLLSGSAFQDRSLVVRTFDDKRDPELKAREGGTDHPAVVTRQDEDWYFNSDDHYDPPLPTAVTAMVKEHIEAARLFHDVQIGSSGPSGALVLNGSIRRFEAYRDREVVKQALATQMGLIGLVLQATDDSPYEADVQLTDVTLTDSAGAILWKGDANGHVAGSSGLESSGMAVYRHADLALKLAVQQLVDQLAANAARGGPNGTPAPGVASATP